MDMKVYRGLAEVEQESRLVGYSRVLQRAWKAFNLTSVLCVNHIPTLYRVDSPTIVEQDYLNEIHRNVWNQGVVSALLVVDPKRAYIFSGMQRPVKDAEAVLNQANPASPLLDVFDLVAFSQDELNQSIVSGQFYRRYQAKFKPATAVDQTLTQNLKYLHEALVNCDSVSPLSEINAHNFICRLLFVCYLQDREIVESSTPLHKALEQLDDDKAIEHIYKLFGTFKDQFNGSMFDMDLAGEREKVKPEHIQAVKSFLRGENPKEQQMSLGFWVYNFKFIPIETISAIYENFLPVDDKKEKGAYYTPRFLAEFTVDVAVGENAHWHELSYVDPSCGSGVFLVTLFNRLATYWELENREKEQLPNYYELKDEALRRILQEQICGIDLNQSACMLTCFSLYVALLDSFSPATLRDYFNRTGFTKLPKLLAGSVKNASDKNYIPAIHVDDSLKTEALHEVADVVIGNPPWGGSHRGTGDISIQFLKKVPHFLKPGGSVCLLLPSRLFLNVHNESFQARWLSENTVERVVQLADFRRILFANASCPCMVLKFKAEPPPEFNAVFIYDTPKFSVSSRRQGLVVITEADRKSVSQAKMVSLAQNKTARAMWKQLFWGTPRDLRFLDFLDSFSKLNALFVDKKTSWKIGSGITRGKKPTKPMKAWWKPDVLFLNARSDSLKTDCFLFQDELEPVKDTLMEVERSRSKQRELFTPPMILFNKGFNKFVFSDFPILFQDTILSIHAPEKDLNLLFFLLAYLKSDLVRYFCFHTSSLLGIERDVIQLEEVLEAPFPLPSDAPSENAAAIVMQVAELFKEEKEIIAEKRLELVRKEWVSWRKIRAKEFDRKLNAMVYEYFDIPDEARWLVEDTVRISLPSSTPSRMDNVTAPTVQSVSDVNVLGYEKGVQTYCETLTSVLNKWAHERGSQWCVNAVGDVDDTLGLAYVAVSLTNQIKPFKEVRIEDKRWIELATMFTEEKVVEQQIKTPFIFSGQTLYILRPSALIHWTRTAALNDADDLFAYVHTMGRQV